MLNLKEKRPHIAQVLLTFLLLCMPMLYFVQKYDYIHSDYYTVTMSKVSDQVHGRLDRQAMWKNQKDENNDGMIYGAYYYPQASSLVCHTTRMHNQDTPPITAYLVTEDQATYPAYLVWDGKYNTTLLIFEDIPEEAIYSLSYLDVIPEAQSAAASTTYDPNMKTSERVRYLLQTM